MDAVLFCSTPFANRFLRKKTAASIDANTLIEIGIPYFLWSYCTPETTAIVVENCPPDFPFEQFFPHIDCEFMLVKEKAQGAFCIEPTFVFVMAVGEEPNTWGDERAARIRVLGTEPIDVMLGGFYDALHSEYMRPCDTRP